MVEMRQVEIHIFTKNTYFLKCVRRNYCECFKLSYKISTNTQASGIEKKDQKRRGRSFPSFGLYVLDK